MKENKYLIAINLFDESQSRFLGEIEIGQARSVKTRQRQRELALTRFDVEDFVGGGYEIRVCKVVPGDSDDDLGAVFEIDGEKRAFEAIDLVLPFPLIEGELSPGIYRLDEINYYEVGSVFELSQILTGLDQFCIESERLVCRPDSIDFRAAEDGEILATIERHPATFFDLLCPRCGQKVITHQKSEIDSRCQIIEKKCEHYIGSAVYSNGAYEPQELADLKIPYKIEQGNLSFEIAPRNWKEAFVYQLFSPDHGDSRWSTARGDADENHFFFVSQEAE